MFGMWRVDFALRCFDIVVTKWVKTMAKFPLGDLHCVDISHP